MTTALDIINQYTQTAPVDIEGLVRAFGVELAYDVFWDSLDVTGQIERLDNGRFKITISQIDPESRKRFTLAHELGHYLFHKDLIKGTLQDNKAYHRTSTQNYQNSLITSIHETQANKIAAYILMPDELVKKYYETNQDVKSLAEIFKVSPEAMKIRLRSLSLLNPLNHFSHPIADII